MLSKLIIAIVMAALGFLFIEFSTSSLGLFSKPNEAIAFSATLATQLYLGLVALFFVAIFIATQASESASVPSNSNREKGKVKWFNVSKGYGFITTDTGDDVFVHFRSIEGDGQKRKALREGQSVEFIVTTGEKGPQAEKVAILKK